MNNANTSNALTTSTIVDGTPVDREIQATGSQGREHKGNRDGNQRLVARKQGDEQPIPAKAA